MRRRRRMPPLGFSSRKYVCSKLRKDERKREGQFINLIDINESAAAIKTLTEPI
jgi:hypothetical protein